MIAIWYQRCVDWFRRRLGVRKQSCDQAEPPGEHQRFGTARHEKTTATVAASGTETALAATLVAGNGKPPASSEQTCNAAHVSATHYTPAQLDQAQVRLKEMELLLINYMQAAALATTDPDSWTLQIAEVQLFIQEMTACISELTQGFLVMRDQMSS